VSAGGDTSLRGVLLDIDGTLIDSNDAHARSWVLALAEHGRDVPFERVRPLVGMGGDKLIPEVTGLEEEHPDAKAMAARKKAIFTERFLPTLRPCPGARDLLQQLRDDGLRLVVATSAGGEESEALLERAGVADLIHRETTKSDVESSKPDPDIVLAALAKGGLAASEVVMIGDTPYDVEAARKAGVGTIALRCGGWWDDAALGAAIAIYDHPAALLADHARSPLARNGTRGA
jgi:HAD superfamily hydrolase (TIGR01509 family)